MSILQNPGHEIPVSSLGLVSDGNTNVGLVLTDDDGNAVWAFPANTSGGFRADPFSGLTSFDFDVQTLPQPTPSGIDGVWPLFFSAASALSSTGTGPTATTALCGTATTGGADQVLLDPTENADGSWTLVWYTTAGGNPPHITSGTFSNSTPPTATGWSTATDTLWPMWGGLAGTNFELDLAAVTQLGIYKANQIIKGLAFWTGATTGAPTGQYGAWPSNAPSGSQATISVSATDPVVKIQGRYGAGPGGLGRVTHLRIETASSSIELGSSTGTQFDAEGGILKLIGRSSTSALAAIGVIV